jgi:imidazolonepropionase-like amidohydrolase
LHSMGVMVVAGSGAGTYFTFPGSGLHDELALLVEAGFTPMEALQTATRNPMLLMGRSDSLGTVEVGMKADLVLLDEDPLLDITNTGRVVGVWKAGEYFDRSRLDSILEEVKTTQARRSGG